MYVRYCTNMKIISFMFLVLFTIDIYGDSLKEKKINPEKLKLSLLKERVHHLKNGISTLNEQISKIDQFYSSYRLNRNFSHIVDNEQDISSLRDVIQIFMDNKNNRISSHKSELKNTEDQSQSNKLNSEEPEYLPNVKYIMNYLTMGFYADEYDTITVLQRENDKQNFHLTWKDYKWGFGNLSEGNFWIGNEILHHLTNNLNTSLRFDLQDFDGKTAWAEYDEFKVGSESSDYLLYLNGYRGNATDSMKNHTGMKFSTYDVNNRPGSCSTTFGGGWWYNSCHLAHLTGKHYNYSATDATGIEWFGWKNSYQSLAKAKMTIKFKLPRIKLNKLI